DCGGVGGAAACLCALLAVPRRRGAPDLARGDHRRLQRREYLLRPDELRRAHRHLHRPRGGAARLVHWRADGPRRRGRCQRCDPADAVRCLSAGPRRVRAAVRRHLRQSARHAPDPHAGRTPPARLRPLV
ncbi:MAG: Cytidine deaminase, partial [uncultured Thermomicrobiales bacterium]